MSLDGYIARRDGSVDWLVVEPSYDFKGFFDSIDVVLMGRKTMDAALRLGGMGSMGSMQGYVFSRSKPSGKRDGVQYTNQPPGALIRELKARPGKDIWLMGGGELARDFLREDLIDRIDLGVLPVLLGEGIALFPSGFPERHFKLVKHRSYPSGLLELSYERAPEEAPRSRSRPGRSSKRGRSQVAAGERRKASRPGRRRQTEES
jgi:dihydrofolate reductase